METELKQPPPPSVLQGAASYANNGEPTHGATGTGASCLCFVRHEHHSWRWAAEHRRKFQKKCIAAVSHGTDWLQFPSPLPFMASAAACVVKGSGGCNSAHCRRVQRRIDTVSGGRNVVMRRGECGV